MKVIYIILILLNCSCESGSKTRLENKIEKKAVVTGSVLTELRFNKGKEHVVVKNDILKTHFNFKNLKELKCETKFLYNDFENENYFIREYEVKIDDTLLITILQRQTSGQTYDYVYLIKNGSFNIINLYGEMFTQESSLSFDFDTVNAYRISKDTILLQDQPSTWCGLANQMDFFQIVDLKNKEITQFVDYDTIVK